jgi:hypothetical protein
MHHRLSWLALAWGLFLGLGGAAEAQTPQAVTFRIEGLETPPVSLRLEARPVTGPANLEAPAPVSRKVDPDQSLRLSLDSRWIWEVHLSGPGLWSAPVAVQPARDRSASIRAWPTGTLAGRWRKPPHEPMPNTLAVRFQADAELAGEVTCPVDAEGAWSCEVPAGGALDLRLRSTGYVSHYLWDHAVVAGETQQLGTLALHRGASVVGRIETTPDDTGRQPPVSATVEVEPLRAVAGSPGAKPKLLILKTRADRKGFFHLSGIPPGSYRVIARQPGFAPAELAPVKVFQDAETALREPLVLQLPASLVLELSPPVDAFGNRWKVELWRRSEISGGAEILGGWNAGEDGRLTRTDLSLGQYLVFVQDAHGAQLALEELALTGGRHVQTVEIPLVWVEGTVRLGEEPLSAKVIFGGPFGSQQVTQVADAEGKFFGYLPREGRWLVFVENEQPSVSRYFPDVDVDPGQDGVALVRLELPDTFVEGDVVDTAGRPVERALVRLRAEGATRDAVTLTDAEGGFSFQGAEEGLTHLAAGRENASSGTSTFELVDGAEAPWQHLVLQEENVVRGRVVKPDGQPLPGAAVVLIPFVGGREYPSATIFTDTDVRGAFELRVPAQATALQGVAYTPGYSLTLLSYRPVPEDEELVLQPQPYGGAVTFDLPGPVEWERDASPKPVLWIEGVALSWRGLQRWAQINGEPVDPANPQQRFPALPPGQHLACYDAFVDGQRTVNGPSRPTRCQEVSVTPLGETTVRFRAE